MPPGQQCPQEMSAVGPHLCWGETLQTVVLGLYPPPQPDKQGGKPGLSKLLASRSHRDADTASRETNELEKFQRWHKQDSQQGQPPCLSEVLVG